MSEGSRYIWEINWLISFRAMLMKQFKSSTDFLTFIIIRSRWAQSFRVSRYKST